MRITWYGHSCIKIEAGDVSVVFDPYRPGSVPGLELPPLTADVCICSHGHDDHFYPQGVTRTGRDPVLPTTQLATYHDDQRGALRGKNLVTLLELGGVRVAHEIGAALPAAASQTPVVDGGGIRPGLERWAVILADRAEPGIFSQKHILMTPGLNHGGLAQALGRGDVRVAFTRQ